MSVDMIALQLFQELFPEKPLVVIFCPVWTP